MSEAIPYPVAASLGELYSPAVVHRWAEAKGGVSWDLAPWGRLSVAKIAKAVGASQSKVYRMALAYHAPPVMPPKGAQGPRRRAWNEERKASRADRRAYIKALWDRIPWAEMNNSQISQMMGVERQAVRRERKDRGAPPGPGRRNLAGEAWARMPLGAMADRRLAIVMRCETRQVQRWRKVFHVPEPRPELYPEDWF